MEIVKVKVQKSIRYKILFVVIPFFLVSFVFLGIAIYFSSNNGITNIAKEFIGYKLKEVYYFYQEQKIQREILDSSIVGVEFDEVRTTVLYAQKFNTEIFFSIPYIEMEYTDSFTNNTTAKEFTKKDIHNLYNIIKNQEQINNTDTKKWNSWLTIETENKKKYVGIFIPNLDANSWFVLLSEENQFYKPVTTIMMYMLIIVIVSLIVMVILILLFVNFLTKPLTDSVGTIKQITDSMDFSQRIRIQYKDEIGILGQYFNNMVEELERSYNQIKNYAYQTVLAKKKEERIRFIFQKYVPKDVINQVLEKSTDTMLIGNKQRITILFSDIRDFTTISERLDPGELVLTLNAYFTAMVDNILAQKGIVDKFIGDAIMAIFGAPVAYETSADAAVHAALEMMNALEGFNFRQRQIGKTQFEIGIGLNTGEAIVGNIGSEQKVDYTVIGDSVNLGARLEGLTKSYKVPILVSEFTKESVVNENEFFFFCVDLVRVKGKDIPVKIYQPLLRKDLSPEAIEYYNAMHHAQYFYLKGEFEEALRLFQKTNKHANRHYLSSMYIDRCQYLIQNPPKSWDGVQTWKTK